MEGRLAWTATEGGDTAVANTGRIVTAAGAVARPEVAAPAFRIRALSRVVVQ